VSLRTPGVHNVLNALAAAAFCALPAVEVRGGRGGAVYQPSVSRPTTSPPQGGVALLSWLGCGRGGARGTARVSMRSAWRACGALLKRRRMERWLGEQLESLHGVTGRVLGRRRCVCGGGA
jgi:hypothetical protein